MAETVINPVDLRGGALFWHVMDTFILQHVESDSSAEVKPGELRWNQETWRAFIGDNRCGTALCLAGYVSEACGGQWLVTHDGQGNAFRNGKPTKHTHYGYSLELLLAEPDDEDVRDYDGLPVVTAHTRAARLLGLAPDDNDHELFAGGNTYEDLVALGEEKFGPRPVTV